MTYEQLTYKPEGARRARTIYLKDVRESAILLSGIEVLRDGSNAGTGDVSERKHIIAKALVQRRVRCQMNLHYGWLEPVADC